MAEPIAFSPFAYSHLTLDAWNGLADTDRRIVADHLVERLEVAGWELAGPPEVCECGPPGQPQPVLQLRDARTGLLFSLVPGGTFRPGYGPDLLGRYAEVYQIVEGWKAERNDDPDIEEGQRWEPEPPETTCTFASRRVCDLRRKPAVTIEPLLMAADLVTAAIPGLQEMAGELRGYWADNWKRSAADYSVWQMGWEKVEPVLKHFGWELPTSAEFEWALRGGVDSLFYWGNELPRWMAEERDQMDREIAAERGVPPPEPRAGRSDPATTFDATMSYSFPPDRPRTWAWCNRFGLAGMLGARVWCRPSEEPDDPTPLVIRGGAAMSYPWQACGEWKSFLNAAEGRLSLTSNYADHNAIRPVVRLRPDPGVRLS